MKFKKEDMIMVEEDDCVGEFKVINQDDWTADHKYQHMTTIFEYDSKFYALHSARSGSPFTDYYYESEDWGDEIDCAEMEEVEVVTKKWKVKK